MADISKSLLEILFLLSDDDTAVYNSKIARILRRHAPATARDLTNLKADELVEQNSELEYLITQKGRDLLQRPEYKTLYYDMLHEYVKQLKKRPEPKGWNPAQHLDMGGLTHVQADMLYLFEENDTLKNAKIARILRRHYSSTYTDLQNLADKGLLARNSDDEYLLTPSGRDLIQRNVSKNTRCEITRSFVLQLKARPERRGSWAMIVAGLASLGLMKSSSAYAAGTSTTVDKSAIPSAAPVATTTATATAAAGTTSSIIGAKTALASIVTVILVTGGAVYITDTDAFTDLLIQILEDSSGFTAKEGTLTTPTVLSGDYNTDGDNSKVSSEENNPHIITQVVHSIGNDKISPELPPEPINPIPE